MDQNIKVLFHEVADLSRLQREEYYRLRGVTPAVRDEIESLLTFDGELGDPFSCLVESEAEHLLQSEAPVPLNGNCGPYRLVRLLGNGGMGAVYLADRADGEIEQRVAIKFVRTGADLPSFRERFLRERQILASLNHPGIARLLDAGHTAGQPYLVMEYVDGIPIDQYASRLDIRGVLKLFLRVTEAVSYAHRNLIIHRDLKPSNILIDAAGEPKLLDFGIAKMLDAPEQTRNLERLLTPDYASPEQFRGEVQTTTTDVYSLGAVLRTLLARTSSKESGGRTGRRLSRDLECILGKAMRNEPEERYASVEAFSEDVRAWLEHRPVRARRGNAWYHTRKFVRRYWLPVMAAALAVTGLATGLLVADHERGVAQRRFQQVRQLSNKFFELDGEIRNLPGATRARHRIVSASLEYLERLGAEARPARWRVATSQDHELSMEIGAAYLQVARVQGVPGNASLGQFIQAKQSLARADAFVDSVLASRIFPRHRRALLLSAEIAHDAMILGETEGRIEDALALGRKAAERLEALTGDGLARPEESAAAARLYVNIALTYSNLHRMDSAARYVRRSVEISRRVDDQPQLSRGLGVLANAARFSGDLHEALEAIRESRAIAEKRIDPDNASSILALSGALWREAMILGELENINLARPQEAVPLLQKAFDLAEELARKDPADFTSRIYLSMAGRELGDILRDGDPARALAVYEHTRRRLIEIKDNAKASRDQVWLLAGSSYALRRLRRPLESKQRLAAALAILRDIGDYPAARVVPGNALEAALRAAADHHADTGRTAAAIQEYEELLGKILDSQLRPHDDLRHANWLSRIYRNLGDLYRRAGRTAQAAALNKTRLQLWRHWDHKLPDNPFVRPQLAAASLR